MDLETPLRQESSIFEASLDQPPRDRLALARWLVSNKNPLTARVMVNRLWEAVFGQGLVLPARSLGRRGSSDPPRVVGLVGCRVRGQ